jgi:hypothetical protein
MEPIAVRRRSWFMIYEHHAMTTDGADDVDDRRADAALPLTCLHVDKTRSPAKYYLQRGYFLPPNHPHHQKIQNPTKKCGMRMNHDDDTANTNPLGDGAVLSGICSPQHQLLERLLLMLLLCPLYPAYSNC